MDVILQEADGFLIHPTDFTILTDFTSPEANATSTFKEDLNILKDAEALNPDPSKVSTGFYVYLIQTIY